MPLPCHTAGNFRQSLLKAGKAWFGLQLQDYFVYTLAEALPPSASLFEQELYLLFLFTAFVIQFWE